ncbi:GFA family protein [Actinoplanes sp. M2I2]|uniref:GFA family protein n=1 Tax=Actinoplanes sp. M2I2 TaxID=1734444 RepID=UPI0020228AAC|nr:GFA family protein [Actinoplanes sp. M2I2]
MPEKFTGRCVCKAISYEFSNAPDFVANCYCRDCQKSSGAIMATYFSVAADDFKLLSGTPRSYPYIAASGNTLERNFCPDCGARLFQDRLSGFPGQVFVMLGSLDDPETVKPPIMEIFTRFRISWTKALDVPQYPGRPDGVELSPSEREKVGAGEGCG